MRLYEQTIPCGTLCYQDCSPFVRLDLVVMELASKSEINYLRGLGRGLLLTRKLFANGKK